MNGNNELSELTKGVKALLHGASKDFVEYFENQRKNYGHHCLGKLRKVTRTSKRVFRRLGQGDLVEAQNEFMLCQKYYDELLRDLENIPRLQAIEIEHDAGQELVEAAMGVDFYAVLLGEKRIDEVRLRTADELTVTPQAWLAGVGDFSSEISKTAEHIYGRLGRRGKLNMTKGQLFDRVLAIVDGVTEYYDLYEGSYPKILSASNRRGQGFHDKERLVGDAGLWTVKSLNAADEEVEEEIDPAQA